jgi:hypothetical protein
MSYAASRKPVKLEYGSPDRLLPKQFKRVLTRRYFPVLGLTYASTVVGIAAQQGDFYHFFFEDNRAFVMSLFVAFWVSVPSLIWIVLKGSHLFSHVANIWFILTAALMSFALMVSYILLPEADLYGLRVLFVSTIPVFFVMYYFFVSHPLPKGIAHFLSALGYTFLLYGASMRFWVM